MYTNSRQEKYDSNNKQRTIKSIHQNSMLVTGSNFNVPNFLGLKTPKFFYITTDISNIVYGSSNGNHQTVIPFSKFERLVISYYF